MITGASLPGATALRKGVDYQNNVLFTASAAAGVQRYSLGSFFGAATLLSTQALTTPGTLGQTAVGTGYALTADGSTNKLHLPFSSVRSCDFVCPCSTVHALLGVSYRYIGLRQVDDDISRISVRGGIVSSRVRM